LTAYQAPSGQQSSFANSRASRSTRPHSGSGGVPARSAAGWPGRGRSCAAPCRTVVSSSRGLRWLRRSSRGPSRRRFHPS
jgi:hypothetical protein